MPSIEFVPDTEPDGPDEELTYTPRRAGRRRVVLGAAVAALLALGLTVHALSSGSSDDRPEDAPPTAVSVSLAPPTDPGRPVPRTIGCTTANPCASTTAVPADLTSALRSAFPQLRLVRSTSRVITTGVLRPTLWSRLLTARSSTLTIRLEMHPATDFDDPKSARVPAGPANPVSTVYARTLGRGLSITLAVFGPLAQLPTTASVRRLVADRRLLAID